MPTYSYACADCGHQFDIHQSFTDDALSVCPECGGTLRKQFNSVGVVFKGSGFYRTDSRSGSVPKGEKKSADTTPSSTTSTTTKPEKSATATTPKAAS